MSLLCSTFVFCPLATAAGPLFALKAFSEMRTDLRITGRRMAQFGFIIGTIATAAWVGAAVWWHVNARRPIIDGPVAALRAGFDGDVTGFRVGFCCEAEQASDEQALAFLAELSQRYGRFRGVRQNEAAADLKHPEGSGLRKRIAYLLEFERKTVQAEAEFVVFSEQQPGLQLRFARLEVFDDNLGDISYPRSVGDGVDRSAAADEHGGPA